MEAQNIKIDWLSFTFQPTAETYPYWHLTGLDDSPELLLQAFYFEFPMIKKYINQFADEIEYHDGFRHYAHSLVLDFNIKISFDDIDSRNDNYKANFIKGVNVEVPSHGLPLLYKWLGLPKDEVKAFYKLLQILKDKSCILSRIDLAFDDFDKTFKAADYIRWFHSGNVSSHFRAFHPHEHTNRAKTDGETFYLGVPHSDKSLRIYDKFIESKDSDDFVDSVRYEFELHGAKARDLNAWILKNPDKFNFRDYLLDWFRILDPNKMYSGSNKSNSALLPEWEAWLNLKFNEVPSPIRVPHVYKEPTYKQLNDYVEIQCFQAVAAYVEINGKMDFEARLTEAALNLKPKYKRLINEKHQLSKLYLDYLFSE